MESVLMIAGLSLLVTGIVFYGKLFYTLRRIDGMITDAIDGKFTETEFSEKRLSRLESKMYRYLKKEETANRQMTTERDGVKSLISDISHQTKTPVANLLLYSQLLSEMEGMPAEAAELLEQMERQTEKLNFLIQSLVKASRLENGIIAVTPKKQDVGKLLHTVGKNFEKRTNGRKLLVLEPESSTACFDWKWTVEALSNLVDNALKYTPEGGQVTLSSRTYEMFVRIDVEDTGIGIAEEEIGKIFTRFYRSPDVREEKGIGIGLYLAREIVARQNGYLKVTSEPGKGSVFSMFLFKNENLSEL